MLKKKYLNMVMIIKCYISCLIGHAFSEKTSTTFGVTFQEIIEL